MIGGGQMYREALALASIAEVTEIAADFEGDVFAPELGPQWHEAARESHTAANGLAYSFITYFKTQRFHV